MKSFRVILFSCLAIGGILAGCGEDPPPPPHPIVGVWTLDGLVFGTVPTGYENGWQGLFLLPDEYFVDLDDYSITFNNDNTYTRVLDFPGPNASDAGTWEIDDVDLTLSSPDLTFDDEFEILGDIEEFEMTLSQLTQFRLLPDAVIDTLTGWTLNPDCNAPPCDPNYPERLDAVWDNGGQVVNVDLWHIFER